MFNRQLSLLAIATLLLSPNLVHANEIDIDRNLSVGNIQIINTTNGTLIQTPNIQVNTPTTTEQPVLISRIKRRTRIPAVRRIPTTTNTTTIRRTTGTSAPLIFNNKINSTQTTVTTTTSPVPNTTVPTPTTTVRSSTTRTSSGDENTSQSGSQSSTSEQQQSVQCSGSGTVVSQSSSTVNGRTVNSEVRRNCN
ncbi:hypothetical protein [Chamaesiphon sp. GL140_3_metabinner_50]|uniref:hypothetical protein n=1 Tax=Chamaesiphon sp. GL140_3_metabinner_50 TaxID=2970812 RepID=UPI0025EB2386|nr:hypothetical protein [Chamaesiphon sp. GL140_3_metabinner_50]